MAEVVVHSLTLPIAVMPIVDDMDKANFVIADRLPAHATLGVCVGQPAIIAGGANLYPLSVEPELYFLHGNKKYSW